MHFMMIWHEKWAQSEKEKDCLFDTTTHHHYSDGFKCEFASHFEYIEDVLLKRLNRFAFVFADMPIGTTPVDDTPLHSENKCIFG